MKRTTTLILFILAILGAILGAYTLGGYNGARRALKGLKPTIIEKVEYDTIMVTQPIPVRVSVVDTIRIPYPLPRERDTVFITLPLERKEYRDSTYRAVVSGFRPSLDTIEVRNKVVELTKVVTIPKRDKWGVGLSGGAALTPQGIQPYIGVGIHYNIITW